MTFLASHMGRAADFEALSWDEAERFCKAHGLVLQGARCRFPDGEWVRCRRPVRPVLH